MANTCVLRVCSWDLLYTKKNLSTWPLVSQGKSIPRSWFKFKNCYTWSWSIEGVRNQNTKRSWWNYVAIAWKQAEIIFTILDGSKSQDRGQGRCGENRSDTVWGRLYVVLIFFWSRPPKKNPCVLNYRLRWLIFHNLEAEATTGPSLQWQTTIGLIFFNWVEST